MLSIMVDDVLIFLDSSVSIGDFVGLYCWYDEFCVYENFVCFNVYSLATNYIKFQNVLPNIVK